jgi:hypothetical protein
MIKELRDYIDIFLKVEELENQARTATSELYGIRNKTFKLLQEIGHSVAICVDNKVIVLQSEGTSSVKVTIHYSEDEAIKKLMLEKLNDKNLPKV